MPDPGVQCYIVSGGIMKIRSKIIYVYIVFVIIYVLITLLPSPDKTALTKYHLRPTGVRLLDLTVMIPELFIWFALLYSYLRLQRYSLLIKNNQDGRQISKLSIGLLVLAIGVPVSAIVSGILAAIARWHPEFAGTSTIISNYVSVIYLLVAFFLIYQAVRNLNEPYRSQPSTVANHAVVLIVITLGVIFCDLIARGHKTLMLSYHMSYSLVMLTLAVPYMYIWFLGLFAIVEIYEYSKRVAGIVYRRAWDRLALGLGSIIAIDILLQYLTTLYAWTAGLSLAGILLLLYVLLLLYAGGFIVVALGTKELMKIEEA